LKLNKAGGAASGVTLVDNSLYGTTQYGGDNGVGMVYSIPVTGGSPTVIASFNGNNGQLPLAGLIQIGSELFGTTLYGGAGYTGAEFSGMGTIFSLPVSGGSPTVLGTFNGSANRGPTSGVLVLVDNNLYGTSSIGAVNPGTVYSIPVSGGTPTILATFSGSNGWNLSGLTYGGNTLYGTTGGSGGNSYGTVFAVNLSPAPEPSTLAVLVAGGCGYVGLVLRRKRKRFRDRAKHVGSENSSCQTYFGRSLDRR
jgi:uncharacterized repeat protein (TIGR03803 family)